MLFFFGVCFPDFHSNRNGAAVSFDMPPDRFQATGNFFVGRDGNPASTVSFSGALDDIAIWIGRVLSASEVAALYAAGGSPMVIGDGLADRTLRLYLPFPNGRVADFSRYGKEYRFAAASSSSLSVALAHRHR